MKAKEKIVEIDWVDSCTNNGWREESTACLARIYSVGLLVKESKEFITIATSRSDQGHHVDQISIPRRAITRMKRFNHASKV